MSYRRYPNRERALRQLNRHCPAPPPSELQQRLAVQSRAALDNAGRELSKFIGALKQSARTT